MSSERGIVGVGVYDGAIGGKPAPSSTAEHPRQLRGVALVDKETQRQRIFAVAFDVLVTSHTEGEAVRGGVCVFLATPTHAAGPAVMQLHHPPLPAPLAPITRPGMDKIPHRLRETGHKATGSNSDGCSGSLCAANSIAACAHSPGVVV